MTRRKIWPQLMAVEHDCSSPPRYASEPVAGHADLAAAGLEQQGPIEIGQGLGFLFAGGLQTGERDRHHGDHYGHIPGPAGDAV
jgi:hypothetical protein